MATPDNSGAIQGNALQPAEAATDGTQARQHPIGDQIKADQYAHLVAGMGNINRGLRFTKLLPPGPVSDGGMSQTGPPQFGTPGF